MMVTSDFRLEVEIQPFHHACTMKNMQYNAYLWPISRNFHVLKEVGFEEHNYRNSLVIVDLAMGQIPRSTERIISLR